MDDLCIQTMTHVENKTYIKMNYRCVDGLGKRDRGGILINGFFFKPILFDFTVLSLCHNKTKITKLGGPLYCTVG